MPLPSTKMKVVVLCEHGINIYNLKKSEAILIGIKSDTSPEEYTQGVPEKTQFKLWRLITRAWKLQFGHVGVVLHSSCSQL